MSQDSLDEREFELVNIVGAKLAANQRELSRQMNLSLGMTNMLLRRLVTKGYIRITQLNQKKVQYILTPKGFTEKMRKSVRYTLKTIDSIGLVKRSLLSLLKEAHQNGSGTFYILGGADLASLIELISYEHFAGSLKTIRVEDLDHSMADGIVLICKEHFSAKGFETLKTINVIEEIAKNQDITGQTAALS
jgi:predicted transcriptional regulator